MKCGPKYFRREILSLHYLHFIDEVSEVQRSSFGLFKITAILVLGLPLKPLLKILQKVTTRSNEGKQAGGL